MIKKLFVIFIITFLIPPILLILAITFRTFDPSEQPKETQIFIYNYGKKIKVDKANPNFQKLQEAIEDSIISSTHRVYFGVITTSYGSHKEISEVKNNNICVEIRYPENRKFVLPFLHWSKIGPEGKRIETIGEEFIFGRLLIPVGESYDSITDPQTNIYYGWNFSPSERIKDLSLILDVALYGFAYYSDAGYYYGKLGPDKGVLRIQEILRTMKIIND